MIRQVPAHIQAVWNDGRRIEAIKLLREATGLGLAEAKALLEGTPSAAPARPVAVRTLPADVRAQLDAGHKIEAIKLLRQASGLGLKEAKDWVEAAETFSRPGHSYGQDLAPGEVPRGNGGVILAVVVAALIAVTWFWFGGR